jgi:hypothetical protein
MNKAQLIKKLRKIAGKDLAGSQHLEACNTEPYNTEASQFISKVYRGQRTYLLRIPKAIVEIEGLRGGELLKVTVEKEKIGKKKGK